MQNIQDILKQEEASRLQWEAETEGMPGFTIAQLRSCFDSYHPEPKRWKEGFLTWVSEQDKDCLIAAIKFFCGDKPSIEGPMLNGQHRGKYFVESHGYQCD